MKLEEAKKLVKGDIVSVMNKNRAGNSTNQIPLVVVNSYYDPSKRVIVTVEPLDGYDWDTKTEGLFNGDNTGHQRVYTHRMIVLVEKSTKKVVKVIKRK